MHEAAALALGCFQGNMYVHERMILHFGYRLVEWFIHAGNTEEKKQHLDTLQKIYEMGK